MLGYEGPCWSSSPIAFVLLCVLIIIHSLFVPGANRPTEHWPIHSLELSLPGLFAPWPSRSLEPSLPGPFAPWPSRYSINRIKNEAIHRASPMYSQMGYIGTGLALCKNIRSPAIHRASPVYSQMRYNWHRASIYSNSFNRWRHIIVN